MIKNVIAMSTCQLARLPALAVILAMISACSTLPDSAPAGPYEAAAAPAASGLIADLEYDLRRRSGKPESGFALLDRATDALALRLALVDGATQTLDVMYYIWANDEAGNLFINSLMAAADRGVDVRILVDDLLMFGEDDTLAALESHPNIRIRLFNPWRNRSLVGRAFEGLAHFNQANRRMHTKLLAADSRAMILGGRNIANEYFGFSERFNFLDLDVLAVGATAREGSAMFDHYWNSDLAISAGLLAKQAGPDDLDQLRAGFEAYIAGSALLSEVLGEALPTAQLLRTWGQKLVPGVAWLEFDKVGGGEVQYVMAETVGGYVDSANTAIQVTNAYFIPEQDDIAGIQALCDRGVRIQFLTNSLESHDVPAVNSHYRPWRKALVGTCLELHELRADAALVDVINTSPVRAKYAGLHSKAAVVDGQYSLIGSFNFDPRSAALNMEMGLIVDSPQLGSMLARQMDRDMEATRSWRVLLGDDGELRWISTKGEVASQPARSWWQRVQDVVFGLFPKKYF